jgi:hypothetical protein
MKRCATGILLLLFVGLTAGCECTKNHVHCMVDACHYPYSCPPCPYYDKQNHAWHRPLEIYTGVPTPTLPPGTVPAETETQVYQAPIDTP